MVCKGLYIVHHDHRGVTACDGGASQDAVCSAWVPLFGYWQDCQPHAGSFSRVCQCVCTYIPCMCHACICMFRCNIATLKVAKFMTAAGQALLRTHLRSCWYLWVGCARVVVKVVHLANTLANIAFCIHLKAHKAAIVNLGNLNFDGGTATFGALLSSSSCLILSFNYWVFLKTHLRSCWYRGWGVHNHTFMLVLVGGV